MTGQTEALARARVRRPRPIWLKRLGDPPIPVALLAVAMAVSGTLLIAWGSDLTFFLDEWDVLLHRRGFSADAFLAPHAEHPAIAIAVVYKTLQATFGMDAFAPYVVASTAVFLVSVALLFVYLRRRLGSWLALAAALLILFLGSAHEDLLSPFQIGYFGSVACGLGALLAVERGDPRGDAITCGLLVASLTFSSVGIPFIAGVALLVALDPERARRAYVVGVPIVLYGLWYLGWGREAPSQFNFDNLASSPSFVLDGFAASVAAVLGFAPLGELGADLLDWGRPLLAFLLVAAGFRLISLRRVPHWLWLALGIGVSFWFLTAINAGFGRSPTASRYLYLGAVFVLLIAAEVARGTRPRGPTLLVVFAIVGAAVASNLVTLHNAYEPQRDAATVVRGGLAGLEIAADTAPPDLLLTPENSDHEYFTLLDAGPYLDAAAEFDSPAYSPAELVGATEAARVAADKVQAAALPVSLNEAVAPRDGCANRPRSTASALAPSGTTLIEGPPGAGGELSLRRFATGAFPIELGRVRGGRWYALELPANRSDQPWELFVQTSAASVVVCELAS